MDIPEVKIMLRCWKEIQPTYEKIIYNKEKLDKIIDARLAVAYDDNGFFLREESIPLLVNSLKEFDISEETIRNRYGKDCVDDFIDEEDGNDFIYMLRHIIESKINNELGDSKIKF